jgi:lipopolysaccharide transport system ATP-binding protein
MSETLVQVENVSKKFCRSLKKSLWYGVKDVAGALNPFSRDDGAASQSPELRPDEFWAVRDVSFELKRGECLGLIGHNGAGKSTLLKVLNGLIPPDTGRITMRGRVAALIELNAGFNPILTGRENIFNQAALLGFSKEETLAKFDAIVDFADIGDFLDMPVQNYSSGMRVRLGFAIAAQMEPDVLLIDEVLAVGDVAFRFKCLNAIAEMLKSSAVVFVTHSMPQVFHICSDLMVLDHGTVVSHGKDLSAGAAHYLALLKADGAQVLGSGEVSVKSLELSGSTAETASLGECLVLNHGSPLRIRLVLACSAATEQARVQFMLWNAEMLPVIDVMGKDLKGQRIDLPSSGEMEVTAVLPNIELKAGRYMLSVIVVGENQLSVYCRHDNAAHIDIRASSASGAQFLLPAEWTTSAAAV